MDVWKLNIPQIMWLWQVPNILPQAARFLSGGFDLPGLTKYQ